MSASGVRARVRAEMTEEIKAVARRHLATDGANLSLRAVARDVGMASSAVYRYFASRDDLLTALIIEAYDSVGEAAERAEKADTAGSGTTRSGTAGSGTAGSGTAGSDPIERWLHMSHAVREWALAEPHQWALIYGSPVPGYQAPQDTIIPATRVMFVIAGIVRDAYAMGRVKDREPIEGRYAEELATVAEQFGENIPPWLVGAAIAVFFQLCGAISSELFGQLNKSVDEDRRGFFEFQMRGAAAFIGL